VPCRKGRPSILGFGPLFTWLLSARASKLLVSFRAGLRGPQDCYQFIQDVASRLNNRVQLTTHGLHSYLDALDHTFGIDVDYGQVVKFTGNPT
jgi:hypothetical protein